MKISLFLLLFMFASIANAQTVSSVCVESTNSQGQKTCIPVSTTNPLPVVLK